jgi:cyclomaltodextrinase / maltogenic alpha-amylase / neopullulanase
MNPPWWYALVFLLGLGGCAARQPGDGAGRDAGTPGCTPAPLAETLFLRGRMNDFTPREDDAFIWRCNAYLLNVDLHGEQAFRIMDARLGGGIALGGPPRQSKILQSGERFTLSGGLHADAGELKHVFDGAATIELGFAHGASAPTITIGPKQVIDASDETVVDPIALSLRYDSRDSSHHKTPFGAVTAGSEVSVALSALAGVDSATLVIEKRRLEGWQEVLEYTDYARVPLARRVEGKGERDVWMGSYRFAEPGIYGYYFEAVIGGRKFLYANNADTIFYTREVGSNGLGAVTWPPARERIRRFRQTVYRADYRVPDWASDAVYYYIFPDRFRNGDPANDPKPGIDRYHDKTVEFHRNWLDKPWVAHSGDGSDDQYANDFFGGDLAGITQKLDYIAELGANTLYINPIFRAASNHKYDTADYRSIDPHFGTTAEFETLNREAAKHGIRVVLDTSLNHTGRDSIYFNQYGNFPAVGAFDRGTIHPESPYASWYTFYPDVRDPERRYKGWAGIPDLPELDKSQRSVRDFFYGNDGVMQYWLDRGLSGWRMDVAPWVPDDFWREWRTAVKARKPDAVTVAETFFDASKFFLGDEFDSTMNYIFRNTVVAYVNGAKARDVYRNIELMRENYPPQAFHALMNLIDSHDSSRALYDFGWRDEHADAAVVELAKRRLRLAVFLQMTLPGAPAIYYGDEVGMTGGDDPFDRGTYPWADLGGKPDLALLADYKKLIRLRKDMPVLSHGSIDAPAYIDDHVIALVRRDETQSVITATNNDIVAHSARVALPTGMRGATFEEALGGGDIVAAADGTLEFEVPPMFGAVLLAHGTAAANVHVLPNKLAMPGLDRARTIRIYLPPGYETSKKRYPVLYMHDGQNLFDAATAYAGEWGVDETLNELANTRGLGLIVVGIDNGGAQRIHELNPWDNAQFGKGEGAQYMDFIVDVVKPYVDAHYRTQADRTHTAIMGSSMGGLISHYAMTRYSKVFGKAGIFSPAYWLAPPIFTDPAQARFARDARLYFYAGGNEEGNTSPDMRHMVTDMDQVVDAIRKTGFPSRNLAVHVVADAQHNEAAWRAEFPRAVTWLFEGVR